MPALALGSWPELDDLKSWLRIQGDAEDDLLDELLMVATEEVQNRCGHTWVNPDVPLTVAQAAVMHAGRLYKRRDSLDGTIGLPDIGMLRVGRFDADVDGLLYFHRKVRFA